MTIFNPDGTVALTGGQLISNVHKATQCVGEYCTIHNPSDHSMRMWPQMMRYSLLGGYGHAQATRRCPHALVHVDPDDPDYPFEISEMRRKDLKGCCEGCDFCCLKAAEVNEEMVAGAISGLLEVKEGLE